jgi:hypothetical protein
MRSNDLINNQINVYNEYLDDDIYTDIINITNHDTIKPVKKRVQVKKRVCKENPRASSRICGSRDVHASLDTKRSALKDVCMHYGIKMHAEARA